MDLLCNPHHWKVEEVKQTEREIVVKATSLDKPTRCQHCGASADQLKPNGSKMRKLIDRPVYSKRLLILMKVCRYICRSCRKTSLQPIEGVRNGSNFTNRLREFVEEETLLGTHKAASRVAKISERAARDIFDEQAARLKERKMPPLPEVIGLDGVYFARKERLMMTDLVNGRVLNMLPTIREDKLIEELMKIPESERKRVRVVVIDMSQSLMRVARAVFPNAQIVNDRYHIQDKANNGVDRVRIIHRGKREGERRRGAPVMIRREILRKRRDALKPHELGQLNWCGNLLPEIGEAYEMKEQFCEIWYSSCSETAKRRYEEWRSKLKDCSELVQKAFEKELTKTIDNWYEEVFAYFDYPYTNGFTERMNQEVKRLQREGKRLSFESMRVKMIFGTALRWQREEEENQHKKRRNKPKTKLPTKNAKATRKRDSIRAGLAPQASLFTFTPREEAALQRAKRTAKRAAKSSKVGTPGMKGTTGPLKAVEGSARKGYAPPRFDGCHQPKGGFRWQFGNVTTARK